MSRPLRCEFEGAFWHVTSRGNNSQDIFLDDSDRHKFLELLGMTIGRYKWIVHEYIEMTTHYHLVIETPEVTLSRGMQWLNSRYVAWFNKRHGRHGHLFGGRFKGILVDKDEYFLTLCRYVSRNPVAAGMRRHPQQWRWSSYGAKAGMSTVPVWLEVDRTLDMFDPNDRREAQRLYRKFIDAPSAADDRIWDKVRHQVYLGGEEWMARIQAEIDRKPRSDDHPKVQRHIYRPRMDQIIEAVSETIGISADEIRNHRGEPARAIVSYLAVYEGIHFHRSVAKELGVGTSRVSALVKECRTRIENDPGFAESVSETRKRLENRPPTVPYVLQHQARDLLREAPPSAST
ncbi:MAG: transposase [Thermoanaerobaculia bacterium]